MPTGSLVSVRVDGRVKKQAAEALAKMGLSLSGGVNLFLSRVAADQAIPFEVKIPNAETRAALEEADRIIKSGAPRFRDFDSLIAALEAPDE